MLKRLGIQRARFLADVAGISEKGFVILTGIYSPFGRCHHAWIPEEQFQQAPPVGSVIDFVADIKDREHADGRIDVGLVNPLVLEVIPW